MTTLPGVYRMLGKDGELLYVGKAKNLKNRVALLNGKMEILTALGKGATFNIELNIEMINGQSV